MGIVLKKLKKGVFLFFAIILLSNFVLANHIITTSTGGTVYNVNEDIGFIYNISVNNSDIGQNANISQVNITIPSIFFYNYNSNGTDAGQNFFINTTTILSWTNYTYFLVNGSGANYFWFNMTIPNPGIYNITITTLNASQSYYSNISIMVNDTTAPNLTIIIPQNITYNYNISNLNYTESDNVGLDSCWYSLDLGVTNTTITCGTNVTGLTSIEGGNTWIIWANDTSGNINQSNVTFNVDTINPNIVMVYPQNITYNYSVSELNYSAFDLNLQTCWYSLDNGSTNTSVQCNTNLSSLSSIAGWSTWTVWANDTGGNINSSFVSFFVDLPPNISDGTPDPSCAFNYSNIKLNATITEKNISYIWLSGNWNGSWQNYTPSCTNISVSVKLCEYNVDSSFLQNGETFNWTFYANDTLGSTTQGSMNTLTLKRITNLSVAPAIPDGLNNWYVSYPSFTLMNPDLGGGSIWYRWDGIGEVIYTSPFSLEGIPNQPNISAGTLELKYWSSICANESEQSQIFYIDLTNPQFNQFIPGNGSIINNLRPKISVYIDEVWQSNSGINLSTVVMGVDGIVVNASVGFADTIDAIANYTPTLNLSYGWHNVSIYAKDNAGWENQTNWSFNISLVSIIELNISSPLNNTYYDTRRVLINVSTDREAYTIEYLDLSDRRPRWRRLCRNCNSYTRLKSFRDGRFNETLGYAYSWHNLTIKATNGYGNSEHNISFFVDSKKPRISRTLPRRRKVVNGSYFYVRYSEDNLQQVKLIYGNNVTGYRETNISNCSAGRRKDCFGSVNLSDYNNQEINYWFNLSDFVRTESSRVTRVNVDTVSPILNISNPNNATYGRYIYFNISVSEKVRYLEYYDTVDSRPRWRRLCSNCWEYGNKRVRKKYFRRGIHNITIRARDYAENSYEETRNFSVDY